MTDTPRPALGSRPGGGLNHDHALHAAVAFDGAPEMIDAGRQRQIKFKALAWGQGHPLLEGASRLTGIPHDLNARAGKQATLKPVRFPALVPHHEAQGLPRLHVHPSR